MQIRKVRRDRYQREDAYSAMNSRNNGEERKKGNKAFFDANAEIINKVIEKMSDEDVFLPLFNSWKKLTIYRNYLLPQGPCIYIRLKRAVYSFNIPTEEKDRLAQKIERIAMEMSEDISNAMAIDRF